jgi:hypothetical protein
MAKTKAVEIPQAGNQEASLISSESLPEFDAIEAEYQQMMAELRGSESVKTPRRGKVKLAVSEDVENVPEDATEEITADQIESMLAFPVNAWLISKDKRVLSKIESQAFATATARLVNKWLPVAVTQWKEEIAFVGCCATIYFSRFEIHKKETMEETKSEMAKERENPPVG